MSSDLYRRIVRGMSRGQYRGKNPSLLGYGVSLVLEIGDIFPEGDLSDLSRAGEQRLHAGACASALADVLRCHSDKVSDIADAVVAGKPFPHLERQLALQHGWNGYAMYRAQVPGVLMGLGYSERVARWATYSGHTARASMQWLMNEERYRHNIPALIVYLVNAAVDNKEGGLKLQGQRFGELMQTWVFKRRTSSLAVRVRMAWELWQQQKLAQQCAERLAQISGAGSVDRLFEMVHTRLEQLFPEK